MTTNRSVRRRPSPGEADRAARLGGVAAGAERLSERLERARRAGATEANLDGLVPWIKAFASGDAEALALRLSWDDLTPELAAAALGAAGERGSAEPLPEWLAAAVSTVGLGRDLRAVGSDLDLSGLPFAELWRPWIAAALDALARDERARAIPAASRPALARELAEEIARVGALAAHQALGEATADDPSPGSYRRFVDAQLADGLLPLYEGFPVLLRQTWTLTGDWLDALVELAERFERDEAAIRERFAAAAGAPAGAAEVRRLASDRHAGGRGVFRVALAGGPVVVYKPRSLATEAGLGRLRGRLAGAGLDHLPPVLAVLERDGYGWMEWAEPADLPDRAHAARWFRRAGTLVALAELLGAEDLHAENVVALRDGPAIVDAEMLLQPVRAGQRRGGSFAAGLLRRGGAGLRQEAGCAGLVPALHRAVSERGRGWQGLGGDGISPVPTTVVAPELPNTPRLEGVRPAPGAFADTLVEGYENAWRFLLERRSELEAVGEEGGGPLAELAGSRVRLLFRPSQEYAGVLDLLATPRYQRRGESGGLLLEAMLRPFAGHPRRPLVWPLVAEERSALERLDVPRFELAVDALQVESRSGTVEGLLVRSALDAAVQRLRALTPAEVANRTAELTAALAPRRTAPAGPDGRPDGAAAALALADEILAIELAAGSHAGSGLPRADRLRALALYDGRLGRALALLAADRRDGGRRFDALRDGLVAEIAAFAAEPDDGETPVGALNGLGSLVWGLVALAHATGDSGLAATAERCAAPLTAERLAADRRLDLEGGAAGALLALLALAELTGAPEPLARARAAGDRLLAAQEVQPEGGAAWPTSGGHAHAGHAHGAAGIARALAALAESTGDERYLPAVAEALAFERALFVPARRNWPVRLAASRIGEARVTWMTAWCHGAAGIALARAMLPAGARDGRVAEEIETAVATTLAAGAGTHDHLCCGAAGRLAALAIAGRREGRPEWLAAAREGAVALPAYEPRLPDTPPGPSGAAAGLFRGSGGIVWLACTLGGAEDPRLLDPAALERPSEAERRGRTGTDAATVPPHLGRNG